MDSDDEVRDRATYYYNILDQQQAALNNQYILNSLQVSQHARQTRCRGRGRVRDNSPRGISSLVSSCRGQALEYGAVPNRTVCCDGGAGRLMNRNARQVRTLGRRITRTAAGNPADEARPRR